MTAFQFALQHDVVHVTGVDARKFLHSQLANDISSLKISESQYSLLLEPTGKITSVLRVLCESEESFALDCETGFGEISAKRLSRFKIRIKCEISSSVRKFVALRGLSAEQFAEFSARDDAMCAWRAKDFAVDLAGASNLREGTSDEFLRARVRAFWPQMGVDITSDSVPSETGLTDVAVSFTKGCYPGQELVERMDSRGATAPQMLRLIRAEAGAKPGDAVVVDGQTIGRYTSVCQEFALALIKRSANSSSIEIGS